MASGASNTRYGSVVGTGADLDVKDPGFRPRSVEIQNVGGSPDEGKWIEGMADGSILKRIAAGTGSLVTGGDGITPLADGFKLGADSDLNVAGQLIRWIATE